MRRDIQELIPEAHRDLIEAVPRGFAKSADTGAFLMGAAGGALLALVVPNWMAALASRDLLSYAARLMHCLTLSRR